MRQNQSLTQSLVDLEIPNHIRLSPDGRQIVYSTELNWGHSKNGAPISNLWSAIVSASRSSHRLLPGQAFDGQPAWHPDGEHIGFMSDRAHQGQTSVIYMHKLGAESPPRPVTSVENDQDIRAWAFSPDGRSIAYISLDEKTKEQSAQAAVVEIFSQVEHPRLRVVELQTGKTKALHLDSSVRQLYWNADSTEIAFTHSKRPEPEQTYIYGTDVSVVSAAELSSVRHVCHLPGPVQNLVWPIGAKLYFMASVPLHAANLGWGVYTVDTTASSGGVEHVQFGYDDDVMDLRHANGSIVALVQDRMRNKLVLLDGTVLYDRPQEIQAFDVVFEAQGARMVVSTSDINHPVEVFNVEAASGNLIQLSNHGKAFESYHFGVCNFLRIPLPKEPPLEPSSSLQPHAGRPEDMDAMYITPSSGASSAAGPPPTALATIVLIHGGPNTALTNSFNAYYFALAPYLLSLGYGLLIPNYRGSSSRGFHFASQLLGSGGKVDYADILTATQFAIDQGYANPAKLLVGGYSHGGFLSCCCAVRNGRHGSGWKFQAAFTGAHFCDTDAMALSSDMGTEYPSIYHEKRLPWTVERDDTRNRIASPLWEFAQVVEQAKRKGEEVMVPPVLIFHGQRDIRCHVSQAWGLRRALQHYDLPFECVIYKEVSHFGFEQKALVDLLLRIGNWCDRYIG